MRQIHIGNEISKRILDLHLSKTEFAKKIGYRQQNINRILDKPSIDTDMLQKISEVLNFDFFRLFTDNGDINVVASGDSSIAALNSDIKTNDCEVLKERIRSLESLLNEKERMLRYLLKEKNIE